MLGPKRSICIDIKRDLVVAPGMYRFMPLAYYGFVSVKFDVSGGGFEGIQQLVLKGIDYFMFRYDPEDKPRTLLSNFPSLEKLVMMASEL